MILRVVISLLVAAALIAAAYLGLTQALGAHPWWAVKVAVYGALAASVVTIALGRPGSMWLCWAGLLVLVGAFVTARYGGAAFAASYAEDAFAGQLWFFGWIATCFGAATALAASGIALSGPR